VSCENTGGTPLLRPHRRKFTPTLTGMLIFASIGSSLHARGSGQFQRMLHHMLNSLVTAKLNPRMAHLLFIGSALLPFLIGTLLSGSARAADGLAVGRLRCEGLSDPLGIQEPQPRLSWIVESD